MNPTVARKLEKSASNLWVSGLLGGALALVGSFVLYGIARLFDIPLLVSMGPPGQNPAIPLTIVHIIVVVAISSVVATAFYALLRRFFARRASLIFQVIALIILLLSFGAPLSQDVSLANKVFLALMHVVTAAAIVWALTLRR